MRMNDMILVSVDDHAIEPPDIYERHLPEKYKSTGATYRCNDQGVTMGVPGRGDLDGVRAGGDRRLAHTTNGASTPLASLSSGLVA